MHRLLPHLLVLAFAATSQAQLTNAFTTTTESWRKIEYTPATRSFSAPGAASFTNARGNPPGALTAVDTLDTYFAFWAPDTFQGDQFAFQGGEFVVDLTTTANGPYNPIDYTIAIRGSNGVLAGYTAPIFPSPTWSTTRVPLVGSLGWKNLATKAALTDADLNDILDDVTGISIMGDFISGTDTTDVDNVYFGPMVAPTPIEFFNSNAAGWTFMTANVAGTAVTKYPSPATYGAGIGNPGGAIQSSDLDDNVNYALAPRAFTGTWATYAQGELSFDIKNTPGSGGGPIFDTYPMVTLTGGGKVFHYSLPSLSGFIPTSWTKMFVPLEPSRNWHVGNVTGPTPTSAEFTRMLQYVDGVRILTEYVSGPETEFLDNVTLLTKHPVPTVVSGHVDLGGAYSGSPAGVSVRIGFFRETWPMGEIKTTLDANGNYSVVCPNYGNVSVTCKGSHWLRSAKSAAFAANGTPRTVNFSLVNGDVDDDNTVTLFDYLILSGSFDTEIGNAGYDARADLDGDGVIGLFDYLILSDSFDQEGTRFE